MRITQNMMSRGYVKRMNRNLAGLSRSNDKLSSGQRYNRVSENTSQTSRALSIREGLYRNEQYTTTLKAAESELSAAEGNLQMTNNIVRNIQDRLLQANTGSMPQGEREMIVKELEGLQGQIMQISNAQFGGKHLFAGSGSGSAPFESRGGELFYNGYPVDDIVTDANGKPAMVDPGDPTKTIPLNFNKDIFVDIGMGLQMNGSGTNMSTDPRSAVKLSTSGLEAFGFGTDADGMPSNLHSLLGKIITDLKAGNTVEMDKDVAKLTSVHDTLLMSVTDIGTRAKYLDDSMERLEIENINLKTTQQELEAIPLDEESINNKTAEMSWMVTLQLGSKIIPPSIFDFIR